MLILGKLHWQDQSEKSLHGSMDQSKKSWHGSMDQSEKSLPGSISNHYMDQWTNLRNHYMDQMDRSGKSRWTPEVPNYPPHSTTNLLKYKNMIRLIICTMRKLLDFTLQQQMRAIRRETALEFIIPDSMFISLRFPSMLWSIIKRWDLFWCLSRGWSIPFIIAVG